MESLRIPSGDLVLDAVAVGPADGPPVVLLHGFPQTSWSWRGVWPALADAGFRVVAPDLRGYSPDARPEGVEAYRIEHLVGDVVAVLDHLGGAAHVVGHDWGAAIAWHLAGRHPERVRTLTTVSVPHPVAFAQALASDEDQRTRSQYMRDWRSPGRPSRRLLDGGLEQVFGGIPAVAAERYLEVLREAGCPDRGARPLPGAVAARPRRARADHRADAARLVRR